MSREWKPGDVVTNTSGARWLVVSGGAIVCDDGLRSPAEALWGGRPIVVIDPEDREQVERLALAMDREFEARGWANQSTPDPDVVDALQAALREFADPKPSKPEEPTGLGAVVEDTEGKVYVRHPAIGNETNAWCDEIGCGRPWSRVAAVKVLSEGVQP